MVWNVWADKVKSMADLGDDVPLPFSISSCSSPAEWSVDCSFPLSIEGMAQIRVRGSCGRGASHPAEPPAELDWQTDPLRAVAQPQPLRSLSHFAPSHPAAMLLDHNAAVFSSCWVATCQCSLCRSLARSSADGGAGAGLDAADDGLLEEAIGGLLHSRPGCHPEQLVLQFLPAPRLDRFHRLCGSPQKLQG